MGQLFFCNIGWMARYEGLNGVPDKIVGGGKYVEEHGIGGEICNFLQADDGCVYGHVETIKNDEDREIRIEKLGGSGDFVEGVDVVWTATHPKKGGRRVVGWYKDATVFRKRQHFRKAPSRQHRIDKVGSYIVRALAKNAYRLELDDRTLVMGRGRGWMGQTPWKKFPVNAKGEIRDYLRKVTGLVDGGLIEFHDGRDGRNDGKSSPSTASDAYLRYVRSYEVRILPRHHELQEKFQQFLLTQKGASEIDPNLNSVDLRFRDKRGNLILAEIKPCEIDNARYAVRTAIGQLLDYRQLMKDKVEMLIVLEQKPKDHDKELAISNGFGIAYPSNGRFSIVWPPS